MDDFAREVIETAYEQWMERRKKKSEKITLPKLINEMDHVWADYRDAQMEEWAGRLIAGCKPENLPDDALEELTWQVQGKLLSWNIIWEAPLWDAESAEDREQLREEQIRFVSWGIAGLWWVKLEGTEIAPLLDYTHAEIETWLKEKEQAEALIKREKTKSGTVVGQHLMFARSRGSTENSDAPIQLSLLSAGAEL